MARPQLNKKILYRINNFAVVDRDDEFGEMDDIGLPLSDVASFGLRDTMVAGGGIIDLPDIGYKTNGKYITIRQHPDMPQNAIYKHVDYPEYNPDNQYYWTIPQQHKTSEATMTQPRYYLLFLNYFTGIFSIRR